MGHTKDMNPFLIGGLGNHEVFITRMIYYLLKTDPNFKEKFCNLCIKNCPNIQYDNISFSVEVNLTGQDSGRLDLVVQEKNNLYAIFEMKFGAEISREQLEKYSKILKKNQNINKKLVLVLPDYRKPEMDALMKENKPIEIDYYVTWEEIQENLVGENSEIEECADYKFKSWINEYIDYMCTSFFKIDKGQLEKNSNNGNLKELWKKYNNNWYSAPEVKVLYAAKEILNGNIMRGNNNYDYYGFFFGEKNSYKCWFGIDTEINLQTSECKCWFFMEYSKKFDIRKIPKELNPRFEEDWTVFQFDYKDFNNRESFKGKIDKIQKIIKELEKNK